MEVALLAEGVDRNTQEGGLYIGVDKSPSSRRAWIEMSVCSPCHADHQVALLAEGVDRNLLNAALRFRCPYVALLAEGVDSNSRTTRRGLGCRVALLAEGVDRNGC